MNELWALTREGLAAHWVDVLSAIGGVLYVVYLRNQPRRKGTKFVTKNTGIDYFSGLALAPLALLFLAAFSQTVMTKLLESSRLTLAGASVLAIFAILQEDDPAA